MNGTHILRALALLGTIVHVLSGLWRSFPPRLAHWPHFVLLVIMVGASATVLLLIARRSLRVCFQNFDLLVPVGIYFLVLDLLALLAVLPLSKLLFQPWTSLKLLNVSYSLNAGMLLYFVSNTIWLGWMIGLLIPVLRNEPVNFLEPFRSFPTWIWRLMGVRFLGVLAILLFLTLGLALMSSMFPLGVTGGFLTALILFPAMILFNLAAFFPPPSVLRQGTSFVEAIVSGLLYGFRKWRRTLLPILLFSLLVGSIPLVTFSFSPGHQSFNVNFKLFWLGDFPHQCAWQDFVSRLSGVSPVPVVNALLELLLLTSSTLLVLEIYHRADVGESV